MLRIRTTRCGRLIAPVVSITVLTVQVCFSPPVRAITTGAGYTALRREKHCDTSLTYAQIQSDPTKYAGKVLELAGKIEGSSSDGASVSVILVFTDDTSASIDLPAAALTDIQDDPTARIRVLVQVGDTGNSNLAPLKVIAYAHESDIRQLEMEAAAKQEARREAQERARQSEERWRKEAQRSVDYGNRRAVYQPPAGAISSGSLAESLSPRAKPLFWPYYNFIAQSNGRLDSAAVGSITFHLLNFADRYNVDPRLVVSMILAESHFNPNATSHSGAMGLGQLMPGTAKALGVDNPYDPVQNLAGSVNYLRSRLDTFADHALPGGGMSFEQASLAMAAYNAGANAVKKYNGIPPYTQTQTYVRKVISYYQQLCR